MTALLIFIASVAAALYVTVGYPILLWLSTRGRSRESIPPGESDLPTVSVLMPVRNGRAFIAAKLETLRGLDYPRDRVQIIVIDDGSEDGTQDIVRSHPAQAVLVANQGTGKASALNSGMPLATGELLFLTDVRQRLDPESLSWLVAQFRDPQVGVATGELMILAKDGREGENAGLYWRYEKWMRKRHSTIDSVLGATGAIYAIRRSLARPLPAGTLLDDMLLPLRAFLDGFRIVFVPEARAWDQETDLRGEFRRKVRTQAGVYQLLKLCPELAGPRNRMWRHFVTHKLGRLFLPWLLLTAFLSSLFLPWPWSGLLAGSQLVLLALALAAPIIPGPGPLRRLATVLRTFLVLMSAAACAVSILFVPAESLWKPSSPQPASSPDPDA